MPLVPADLLERENIINESVEKAAKTFGFFKDSHKTLDKKKNKVYFEYNQKSAVDEKYKASYFGF